MAGAERVWVGGLKVGCDVFLPAAALMTDVSPSSLHLFLRDVSAAALKSCSESGRGAAVSGPGGGTGWGGRGGCDGAAEGEVSGPIAWG